MSYPADSCIDFAINHKLRSSLPEEFSVNWGSLKDKETWIQLITETMGYRLSDKVIEQFFGNGSRVLFCYAKNNDLVGTCGWIPDGKKGRLSYTAVKENFRRKGIGASLVSFVVDEIFNKGCAQAYVQTTLNRPVAMRMYLMLGFEFVKSVYPVTKEEVANIAGISANKGTKQIWSRIGSKVAGWWINLDSLTEKSLIYSFGLGSDISFELELIKKKGCTIHGFDPTPGVMELWKPTSPKELVLYNCGLDAVDCKKMMSPLHEGWVTYTVFDSLVVEKDKTRIPKTVELKRLSTIMKELGHKELDILKIDIEGCEYAVIDDVIKCNIKPKIFMIEWHKLEGHDRASYIKKIEDFGYTPENIEDINYVFVRI